MSRILELRDQINVLEKAVEELLIQSEIARLVDTIPGYGVTALLSWPARSA